jgi:uncharacterized membrane protein YtjA (UPF0391 family)
VDGSFLSGSRLKHELELHVADRRCRLEFPGREKRLMLKWAFIFLVFGLIAGALGFGGIAGASIGIAKFLFFLFLIIFVVMLILGLTVFRSVSGPR